MKKTKRLAYTMATALITLLMLFVAIFTFSKANTITVNAQTINDGSYAQMNEMSAFLGDYKDKFYRDKVRSYIFTNDLNDFGSRTIDGADDKYSVGATYDSANNKTGEIYCYFYSNGNLYDCIVYAPVETIYASVTCKGVFSEWHASGSEDMEIVWSQSNVEEIIFRDCFNTSKVTSMNSMFGCLPKLTKLDLSCFDTSNVNDFYGMFLGCNSLKELNISSFNFSSASTSACLGMLGANKDYMNLVFAQLAQGVGDSIYSSPTREEKIEALANLFVTGNLASNLVEGRYYAETMFNTNIAKIIAPANVPSDLILGLPGGENGELVYYPANAQTEDDGTWKLIGNTTLTTTKPFVASTGVVSDMSMIIIATISVVALLIVALKKKKVR